MKVTVCEPGNRPGHLQPMLDELCAHITREQSKFLLSPEVCFAEWYATDTDLDRERRRAATKSPDHIPELDKLSWIISPEGDVLVHTSEDSPFATIEIDLQFSQRRKSTYPGYVAEQ